MDNLHDSNEPVATGKQFLQVEELLKDMLDTLPYNSPDYWIGRIKEVMPLYTSPPASKPHPLTGILSIARHHPDGRVVTVSFKTKDEARTFERYAIEAAHGIKGDA